MHLVPSYSQSGPAAITLTNDTNKTVITSRGAHSWWIPNEPTEITNIHWHTLYTRHLRQTTTAQRTAYKIALTTTTLKKSTENTCALHSAQSADCKTHPPRNTHCRHHISKKDKNYYVQSTKQTPQFHRLRSTSNHAILPIKDARSRRHARKWSVAKYLSANFRAPTTSRHAQ